MDTSETYIKMCDCLEIQEQKSKILKISNEFSVGYQNKEIWINHEGHFFFKGESWLPRQDQIQEMMPPYDHPSTMIMYFSLFANNEEMFEGLYGSHRFKLTIKSMEQLWLAFYMHEKYGKTWSGAKWVEVDHEKA